MSLSTLNSPPLIASLGGGAIYAFPKVLELAQTGAISFAVLKGTNFLAYAVQTVAVARPGRMDGEVAKAMEGENQSNKRNSKQESTKNISKESSVLLPGNGRTLVAPAGWYVISFVFQILLFFSFYLKYLIDKNTKQC